jgi:thiol-disulfide isomerase/thioredoxin
MKSVKTLILFTILGLLQSSNSYGWDSNTIFSGGSLNAAKQRAEREHKLLILEFTAKWCLPCRHMEKQVFRNKDVQSFSQQYAIIFQIDIDENKNLKEEFNIEVLPTIILMKANGVILSRREESLNAESFIAWLDKNKDVNPELDLPMTFQQSEESNLVFTLPNLDPNPIEKDIQGILAHLHKTGSTPKENNQGYCVQAGVFTVKLNAENLRSLLKLNYQEEIEIIEEHKDQTYYKVYIGRFNNRDEAEIFKQVLEKNNFKAIIRLK